MFFNSFNYAIFLVIVFLVYWFLLKKSRSAQNILLLAASYVFYGFWNVKFLSLLAFSTALDYYSGIKIENAKTKSAKKFWLFLSITINIGFLALFKYYNFFVESFAYLLNSVGFQAHIPTLNVILPVGISFYTFHGISYIVDIYYGKIKAEKNPVDYSLFVSFFPLLVAGPIERATHLLPQIKKDRVINPTMMTEGMRLILWGLVKKIVIADRCADVVNQLFSQYRELGSIYLILGCVLFAVQIYADFSGYSDIALGSARLLGFELLRNFNYPYFSKSIPEFWKRWHISLSSWFRDYLYIPLGGSRGSRLNNIRNVFAIFIVSGFWHGANWTFIVWGALHALFYLPQIFNKKARKDINPLDDTRLIPGFRHILQMTFTFAIVCLAWVYFRSLNVAEANEYIINIFKGFSNPSEIIKQLKEVFTGYYFLFGVLGAFFIVEWQGRSHIHPLYNIVTRVNQPLRFLIYLILVFIILFSIQPKQESFIYFQF